MRLTPAILAVALLVPPPPSVSLIEAVRHALSHAREGRIAESVVARNDVPAADVQVANEEAQLITAENRGELLGFLGPLLGSAADSGSAAPAGPESGR